MPDTKQVAKGVEIKLNDSVAFLLGNIYQQVKNNKKNKPTATLWLSGGPGIGKSEIMEQVCRASGFGLIVKYLGTMLIEQITGLPKGLSTDSEDFTQWTKPEIFSDRNYRVKPQPGKPTVLLLDDAHLCNKSIQSYLFQLLTLRSIHDHVLPDNVAIVLAGNRSDDKAGFQQIMAPISNRIFFVNVTCDVKDWIMNFAMKNNIRIDIISFLNEYQSCFQSAPLESEAWASPRSWTNASDALDSYQEIHNIKSNTFNIDQLQVIMSGHIGTEYANEYIKYVKLFIQWEADKILAGKKNLPDPSTLERIDAYCLMSAMVGSLLSSLREKKFDLDKEAEAQIAIFKTLIEGLMKKCKEVIPLGLKLLIMGENEAKNRVVVARKILTNEYLINAVADIIS